MIDLAAVNNVLILIRCDHGRGFSISYQDQSRSCFYLPEEHKSWNAVNPPPPKNLAKIFGKSFFHKLVSFGKRPFNFYGEEDLYLL